MIVSHMQENSAAGLGFALKVMEEARKGYYYGKLNGIPDDTLRLLREINIPEWCITQLSQITYMFPRAHCIELLIPKMNITMKQLISNKLDYPSFLRSQSL